MRSVTVNKDNVFLSEIRHDACNLSTQNERAGTVPRKRRIMDEDTLVVLATYNSVMEAEIGKSKLESAGIWSTIRNEYMSALYPTGAMPAELVVRSDDFEKAQRLLQ